MNRKYKIVYFPLFYNDLDKITNYMKYDLQNEIAAKNFVDKLEKEINQRMLNPVSYEKYLSTKNRKDTYYRIYINNYTVFYTVKDDTVEIRRLLGSRQNFDNFLYNN